MGFYTGQPVSHPLAGAGHVEDLEAYRWPSPDWFDFSHVRDQCRGWEELAIIGGPWVVVYTNSTELLGTEEFWLKLHTHPDVIEALLGRVSDFYYELTTRFFEAASVGGRPCFDIFFFGERRYEATDLEGHRWHFAERFADIVARGGRPPEPPEPPEG